MFEEEIDGRIIGFVVFVIVALIVGILFENTPFGGILFDFALLLFAIGIIVVILYLLFTAFISLNNHKNLLESQEQKIANLEREKTELEIKLNPKTNEAKYSKKVKKEIGLIKSLSKKLQ